jgi:alkanesulfonate monooxygenase SsuD/methylene tetrahydromethanopterin reductase-like flavin-dependent oxidoreductase (luciferase family)
MMFALRFDFRNPPIGATSMAERYAAALDMVEWADQRGCVNVTVSEHHGSADGYLPSPLPMVAAMAQRATNVRFTVAAIIAPFHDPLRLAEDVCVVDNLTQGRLDLIVAAGYAREEFEMFDVAMNQRPARVTEAVTTLKAAFAGAPFEYRGRTVQVTPPPYRPGGPQVRMGGASEPAARRAARIGDGFMPTEPHVWDWYRDEMITLGKPDPGPFAGGDTSVVAIAEDAEKGWDQLAPFFLHEMNAYGAWQAQDDTANGYRIVDDVDALRATGQYRVVTPDELVSQLQAAPIPFAMFHPLVGGTPPELAWESLRLFEREVLPEFASPR